CLRCLPQITRTHVFRSSLTLLVDASASVRSVSAGLRAHPSPLRRAASSKMLHLIWNLRHVPGILGAAGPEAKPQVGRVKVATGARERTAARPRVFSGGGQDPVKRQDSQQFGPRDFTAPTAIRCGTGNLLFREEVHSLALRERGLRVLSLKIDTV